MTLVLVAVGGALGAPTRWWVDVAIQRRWVPVFPWGTFTVNVLGSLLLGGFAALWVSSSSAYAVLGVGFCGSLTTFSSFAWETQRLAVSGSRWPALANVIANAGACIAAAAIGWIVTGQ